MRIMGFAVTGMAVALTSVLAVCVADPAFAAKKGAKGCTGLHQALQNGECVNTTFVNPDRVPNTSAQFYRSSHHKKKTAAKAN